MFSESVLAGSPFPSRQPFKVILHLKMCWNDYTLSHLSVYVVNRLLHENRKSIPKILSGKKLLKM